MEHAAGRLQVERFPQSGPSREKTDLHPQSGGDIDASMASACLENLENLNKKGVDMEVICNTISAVYSGGSLVTGHSLSLSIPLNLLQQCRTRCVR